MNQLNDMKTKKKFSKAVSNRDETIPSKLTNLKKGDHSHE